MAITSVRTHKEGRIMIQTGTITGLTTSNPAVSIPIAAREVISLTLIQVADPNKIRKFVNNGTKIWVVVFNTEQTTPPAIDPVYYEVIYESGNGASLSVDLFD